MTEAQAVEAMLQHWADAWEALHPDDADDPDYVPWIADGEQLADPPARWARISIIHTASGQITTGGTGARRFERLGRIAVQLFADAGAGRAALAELADDVRTCLEGARMGYEDEPEHVHAYAGQTSSEDTDGRWLMAVVHVPFRYDQIR